MPMPMHSRRRGDSAALSAGDPTLDLEHGREHVRPVDVRARRHEARVDRA